MRPRRHHPQDQSRAFVAMTTKQQQQTVILYPSPGVGHIVPMVQLARVFLRHGYDVTMVIAEPAASSPDFRIVDVDRLAARNPGITFHVLPPVPHADLIASVPGKKHHFLVTLQLLRRYNDELERFLRSSMAHQRVHSLVVGMFSTDAFEVGSKLGVPTYTLFASAASTLAVVAQLPALLSGTGRRTGLKELGDDAPLRFLGVPPFPASHLVRELLEDPDEDELCRTRLRVWGRVTHDDRASGVLVNTFESLESPAVRALRDPRCVPGRVLPQVYCVGPLLGLGGSDDQERAPENRHGCLAWLDLQPEKSVVFLCFGSRCAHSAEQLREIAAGLDRSGHRFLWAVRPPPPPPGTDDDDCNSESLDTVFPEGFLERTKDRGLVVRSWAPQVDVLRHASTGAFVTHCGWNSTLEAVTAGVPMLCWPFYAEQLMNKVFVTEDMGVGAEMEGYSTGLVRSEEVEAKVRLVMEESEEEGRRIRSRAAALKEEARAAVQDGGSSQTSFARFLLDAKNLHEQLG